MLPFKRRGYNVFMYDVTAARTMPRLTVEVPFDCSRSSGRSQLRTIMTPGGSILFRVPAVASRLSCLSGNLSGRWNSAPPAQYKRLRRCFSTEQPGGGEKDYSPAPTSDVLPHASEEAAALGKIRGEGGPQIEEQGTPIQEVCFCQFYPTAHRRLRHTSTA